MGVNEENIIFISFESREYAYIDNSQQLDEIVIIFTGIFIPSPKNFNVLTLYEGFLNKIKNGKMVTHTATYGKVAKKVL